MDASNDTEYQETKAGLFIAALFAGAMLVPFVLVILYTILSQ